MLSMLLWQCRASCTYRQLAFPACFLAVSFSLIIVFAYLFRLCRRRLHLRCLLLRLTSWQSMESVQLSSLSCSARWQRLPLLGASGRDIWMRLLLCSRTGCWSAVCIYVGICGWKHNLWVIIVLNCQALMSKTDTHVQLHTMAWAYQQPLSSPPGAITSYRISWSSWSQTRQPTLCLCTCWYLWRRAALSKIRPFR